MTSTDRTAAVAAVVARDEPPDDPDPDPHVLAPDIAVADVAGDALTDRPSELVDVDTRLDGATAARLRDESRRSRARIARRLADARHHPSAGGVVEPVVDAGTTLADDPPDRDGRPDRVDEWRDLGGLLDENVEFLEHIDGLHERRLASPSPRERQAATRALAEALYRIVDGYWVDDGPPHRPVRVVRTLDDTVGRAYARLARRRAGAGRAARTWARVGRWVRLGLAVAAASALAEGLVAWGAAAVVLRALLSLALVVEETPESPRRRLLGYNTQWAPCVCTHVGDAAILAGLGIGLQLDGRTAWGAATAFAALFGVTATMTRVAASSQGFRLPRMFVDRAAKAVALPVATVGAALFAPGGLAGGVPVAAVAVVVVSAVALSDLARVVYWALRRRRLFRRVAAAGGGLVPDVIVAHTSDALVMNITRSDPRPTVFGDGGADPGRHLHAVDDAPDDRGQDRGAAPPGGRARRRMP
jgi:hypothetical protein